MENMKEMQLIALGGKTGYTARPPRGVRPNLPRARWSPRLAEKYAALKGGLRHVLVVRVDDFSLEFENTTGLL